MPAPGMGDNIQVRGDIVQIASVSML